jgi:hypothetical protein
MKTEDRRTCSICGNGFSGAMEFCPVCMLRKALADGVECGESSSEDTLKPTSQDAVKRFEHYQLVTGEDRKPVELGRGAMGSLTKRSTQAQGHGAGTKPGDAIHVFQSGSIQMNYRRGG